MRVQGGCLVEGHRLLQSHARFSQLATHCNTVCGPTHCTMYRAHHRLVLWCFCKVQHVQVRTINSRDFVKVIYHGDQQLSGHMRACLRPARPPSSMPTRMASRHSSGWVRWGARFCVSARANSRIGSASPRDSSLSVLQCIPHIPQPHRCIQYTHRPPPKQ